MEEIRSTGWRVVRFLKTEPELIKWVCSQYSPDVLPPIPDELKTYSNRVDESPIDTDGDTDTDTIDQSDTMDEREFGAPVQSHTPAPPRGSQKPKSNGTPNGRQTIPPSIGRSIVPSIGIGTGSQKGKGELPVNPPTPPIGKKTPPPIEVPPTDEVEKLKELAKQKEAERSANLKKQMMMLRRCI